MIWEETIAFLRLLLVFYCSTSAMLHAVSTCEVHPKDVVVAAGDRVSLNCSSSTGLSVVSWQLGADVLTKIVVYTATVYRPDGSLRTPSFVAKGYSVDEQQEHQAILSIDSISLAQAGRYYCTCSDDKMTAAPGDVVVIEPKLSTNASVCNGEPVAINCNITSSEDISYDIVLEIKDALGNTVARKSASSSYKDVVAPSFAIIANESLNETFRCIVDATTNKDIHFTKVLRTSIEYSNDCSGNDDSQNSTQDSEWNGNWIAIPVVCSLFVLAVVILVFFLLKYRRRNFSKITPLRD